MFFTARCKRLVYRTRGFDSDGDLRLTAFNHDPKSAQDTATLWLLKPHIANTLIDLMVMEFDGWKVVG